MTTNHAFIAVFKRLLYIPIILIIFNSCSSVKRTLYQDKGLQFKITEDFRIGRADTYKKNQATYIPIYCRSNDIYAKFSIVWVPCRSDLDWEIQNYVDGLNSVYKSDPESKPVYSEVRTIKFGENEARQIDYAVANDGPRVGSYTTFHCNNFTVIIGQHATVESLVMANRCRKMIEETYYCIENP
jgi:hypothetical protein